MRNSLLAARSAKILCSAVFLSEREVEEAITNSVLVAPNFEDINQDSFKLIKIDREAKEVHVQINDGPIRISRYQGDLGCTIIPADSNKVFFQSVKVDTTLPEPMTQSWPMGDLILDSNVPPEVNNEKLEDAITAAFEGPNCFTTAFLVVYKGKIIAERYDLGVNKESQLESFSMGKSIVAALIGVLIQQGNFNLEDRAPIPQWHHQNDPRSEIRVADLLRMSSGLKFSGVDDSPTTWEQAVPDHQYVYCGAIDVFQFAITRPSEHPSNEVGRYRNCDPLSLGYIIRKTVTNNDQEYHSWPQRALFDCIGIRKQVLETDPYGNFLLTGSNFGTPRNWARLGLLFLQNGIWMGKRILPDRYVNFIRTPAPAWDESEYGGLFRLNLNGKWNLPRDSYYMSGAYTNVVFIVPSYDLIIVRMGHQKGYNTSENSLNNAFNKLINAISNI